MLYKLNIYVNVIKPMDEYRTAERQSNLSLFYSNKLYNIAV